MGKTRQRKPFIIHSYFAGEYQNSEYCDSATETKRKLCNMNVRFKKIDFVCPNYEDGILYSELPWVYEIEEAIDEIKQEIMIGGVRYIPVAVYAKKKGITKNTAFKRFYTGKITGINVGKGRLIYVEDN